MTKFLVTKTLAQNVLETVDAGLVSGMGVPKPGQMCVEAAVCYAMGLPHSDRPTCVSPAVRALKIRLNDSSWSSNTARANGLRRLAIAQLGSNEIDDKKFVKGVILGPCKTLLIKLFKTLKIENDLEEVEDLESFRAAAYAAADAADAAYAAADADEYAAARDKVLSYFAEGVVQVLIKMDSPGCKFLSLTEG